MPGTIERGRLGRFARADELTACTDLPPTGVNGPRELLLSG